MMKSLMRWGVTIGLTIGITFTSWLGFNQQSLALPEPQVIQKLEQIPMFVIVSQNGNLILINSKTEQGSEASSGRVVIFGSYSDALKMLGILEKSSSELAGKIKIIPIAFSRVYELLKKNNQEQNKMPPIALYSKEEEMNEATKILQQRGKNLENLQKLGFPLFFITVGQNEELVVKQNQQGNPFIPLYMALKDATADVEQYKKQFPDRKPEEIKIHVVPLLEMVQIWLQKDEEAVKIMQVIPSQEQLNEAQKLLQNNNSQNSR